MPTIQMTAISSRDLSASPKRFLQQTRIRAKKGLQKWAKLFISQYRKTVASWDKRPVFTTKYESNAEGESVTIATDNIIYRFLHDGTKVRWAVMGKGYKPKTTIRSLSSTSGGGYVALRGKGQMLKAGYLQAMPGIEAREWTQAIIEQYEPRFQSDMDKMVFGDFK